MLAQEASGGDALPKEGIRQERRRHGALEIRDPAEEKNKGKVWTRGYREEQEDGRV